MTSLKLFIDNQPIPQKEIPHVFRSMRDRKILQANGGFLLKIRKEKDSLFMGILPVISQGNRNKHYEIGIPGGEGPVFSGFYNSDETLGMIPLPEQGKDFKSPEMMQLYINSYRLWAAVLIEWKWPERTLLDWSTKKILSELGVSEPIPKELSELKNVIM